MDLDELLDKISTIKVHGRRHVVMPFSRRSSFYPDPNYRGTKKALIGVLKPYETLIDFGKKYIKSQKKISKTKK